MYVHIRLMSSLVLRSSKTGFKTTFNSNTVVQEVFFFYLVAVLQYKNIKNIYLRLIDIANLLAVSFAYVGRIEASVLN